RDNLSNAMHCPGAIGNPFLHLRLGQCQFELGALDRAADELMRAYMGAGADIFKDQDPKYLKFLQSRAQDVQAPKKSWQFWKRSRRAAANRLVVRFRSSYHFAARTFTNFGIQDH